jgi:nucleoside phosphorylase
MLPDKCDVGIVVALAEEFRELQRQFADQWKPLYDEETATDYYLFTSEGPAGDVSYSCVTTFAGSMGPAKAALLTEKLRTRWRVGVLVSVGIAGALDDDVRLGDVIAASVADSYLERAKAVDAPGGDGFAFDLAGEPFRSSRALVDACAHLEFAHPDLFARWRQACQSLVNGLPAEQLTALRAAGLLAELPALVHGHVACGSSVGASVAFKRWLKKRDRSYLTLDMESSGVLLAVYEAARTTEGLVLRGVSDFADERKAEFDRIGRGELRRIAMHNALQFLWSLMKAGRLPRAETG